MYCAGSLSRFRELKRIPYYLQVDGCPTLTGTNVLGTLLVRLRSDAKLVAKTAYFCFSCDVKKEPETIFACGAKTLQRSLRLRRNVLCSTKYMLRQVARRYRRVLRYA